MPEVSPEAGKTGLFTEMPTPNDPDWSTIGPHESVDIANFPMKRVAERAGFESHSRTASYATILATPLARTTPRTTCGPA